MYKVTKKFSAFPRQKEISHRKGENEKCSLKVKFGWNDAPYAQEEEKHD